MQHEEERTIAAGDIRQLDLQVPARRGGAAVSARRMAERRPPTEGPVPLCVVCGRSRARLALVRKHGQAPLRVCLRCHHGVMQQRRILRAGLTPSRSSGLPAAGTARREGAGVTTAERHHHLAGDAGLIVPRDARFSDNAKYAALTHRRRRAQVAARRALEKEFGVQPTLLPAEGPNLLDRAS